MNSVAELVFYVVSKGDDIRFDTDMDDVHIRVTPRQHISRWRQTTKADLSDACAKLLVELMRADRERVVICIDDTVPTDKARLDDGTLVPLFPGDADDAGA